MKGSADFLGTPGITVEHSYWHLVPIGHSGASRLRLDDQLAVSSVRFNFKRVLSKITHELNDIVFYRYNGQEMFRLHLAGTQLINSLKFERVLAKIERIANDIIFDRYNGQEMFRLPTAGKKE